jgi:hypothetical protein
MVEAGRRPVGLHLALDLLPFLEEDVQVADEIAGLLALAGGAHDDAHALGDGELVDELLEAQALLGSSILREMPQPSEYGVRMR